MSIRWPSNTWTQGYILGVINGIIFGAGVVILIIIFESI